MKYKIYSIDVWGNEEDGWEQNDYSNVGSIEGDYPTDELFWLALVEADIAFGPFDRAVFDWFDEGDGEIRDRKDDRPIFQIRGETIDVTA